MRTVLITLAAAASALAVASPASAQNYGNLGPVYGAPGYGYGYGAPRHGYGYSPAHALQLRVDGIQRQISHLARYRMITHREYRDLRGDSRDIERRLRRDARDGYRLTPREAYSIERRVARLEQKIARDVRDGRRWGHRWDRGYEIDRDRWDREGRWDRD